MARSTFVLAAVVAIGCGGNPSDLARPAEPVAASIPPHAWLIEAIGGEGFDARAVLTPGDSPATYQPGDAEVSAILGARLFFRTGVPFEAGGWFDAVSSRLEVVDLRQGLDLRPIEDHAHPSQPGGNGHRHGDAPDPHIWLSPKRLPDQARTIATALQRLQPDQATTIQAGLERVVDEIESLDHRLDELFTPHRGRTFVVFHPSWGYFAEDYGLRQVAIETGGKEPSDAEITELRKTIRSLGVTVVFVQPQIAGRSAAAVAEAAGARLETLDPLRADVIENLREAAHKIAGSLDD